MKNVFKLVIPIIALIFSLSAVAADPALSAKSKRVSITVSGEVATADEKTKSIKDYKVIERLLKEMESQMGGFPQTYLMEVTITGYRLRSGKSGFFGFSGGDMISGEITIKDKGKQINYFSIEASNGKSGKTQPPTRRIVELIHRFGEKAGRKLDRMARRSGGGMPSNININIR